MNDLQATRASLLVRIRDGGDADAWREFVRTYAPVVYGFARKRGLQDADAADLMQDVLRSVVGAAGRLEYDPQRGTFRGWLYTVTRNRIFNFLDGRRHREHGAGDTRVQQRLEEQPATEIDLAAAWDGEYERALARRAMEAVRGEFKEPTWKAFHGTAVEGRPAAAVGAGLGMSAGAVHVAKSRVLARLREEVHRLQDEEGTL